MNTNDLTIPVQSKPKRVRRGSTSTQLHVRLDRLSEVRVEALRHYIERKLGVRPSDAVVIRAALGIAATAGMSDDTDELAASLEKAAAGR